MKGRRKQGKEEKGAKRETEEGGCASRHERGREIEREGENQSKGQRVRKGWLQDAFRQSLRLRNRKDEWSKQPERLPTLPVPSCMLFNFSGSEPLCYLEWCGEAHASSGLCLPCFLCHGQFRAVHGPNLGAARIESSDREGSSLPTFYSYKDETPDNHPVLC